jgi:hypothetical protein
MHQLNGFHDTITRSVTPVSGEDGLQNITAVLLFPVKGLESRPLLATSIILAEVIASRG